MTNGIDRLAELDRQTQVLGATAGEFQDEWERQVFDRVLSTETGRAFLWYLFNLTDFPGEGARGDMLADGRRNVGLDLFNNVMARDPAAYAAMVNEAAARARQFQTRAENSLDDGVAI